jgi:hypothetical protein
MGHLGGTAMVGHAQGEWGGREKEGGKDTPPPHTDGLLTLLDDELGTL